MSPTLHVQPNSKYHKQYKVILYNTFYRSANFLIFFSSRLKHARHQLRQRIIPILCREYRLWNLKLNHRRAFEVFAEFGLQKLQK